MAKAFHSILLLSIGTAFSLCLGEFAFRFYAPRLGTHDDFKRFSAAARQQGQSIGEYAKAIDQRDFAGDPAGRNLLGWSRTSNEYNSEAKRSILLLGDSVTQGDGLEPQDIYPYLLSRKLAGHDVKILNAGSSGYGIDQMLFKGLRESHKDRPDLILFSFIPHGLIRIGKNFM